MRPKQLFCITGPDGSGKSTLVAGLISRLKRDAGMDAREVSVWDLMRQADVRASFPIDPRRIDEYLSKLGPASRAHFLLHAFAGAMERALASASPVLILNGYWYKYLACEIAHGGSEPDLLAMTAGFPEPELVLYLDIPTELAASRKQRFTGYESGFAAAPDAAAFAAFQAKARPALSRLGAGRGWIPIDGAREPDAVLDSAWVLVQELVRGRGRDA